MTFFWTTSSLLISAAALIVALAVCFVSWRRSGFASSIGWLELLRFALISVGVITLNQPDFVQTFQPETRPVVAVLVDESRSMETADVTSNSESLSRSTRAESVAELLDETTWSDVAEKVDVVRESFSSRQAPPTSGTDIHAALQTISERANLRAVVLASDGDWNTGDAPGEAATQLRLNDVPVFCVGAGSEVEMPDLKISAFDVPTFAIAGKPLRIPWAVDSSLPRDVELSVTLSVSDGKSIERRVRVPGMGRIRDTLEWRPESTGDFELTLAVPPDSGEYSTENNTRTIPITVRHESLRVLVVDSYPRWEYRYLRNALERDPGVTVNCVLLHPQLKKPGGGRGYLPAFPEQQDLFQYDVVFVGDIGVGEKQLTVEQCRHLKQLVSSHAGGLVFLPGFRGFQDTLMETDLDELLPVVMDRAEPTGFGSPHPAQFVLTESGRRSLLTRLESVPEDNARVWRSLPGFQWYAAALRARAGSDVLATHQTESTKFGRVPLIVTRGFGTGKVLFMGTDAAWRWRKGVEDLYHYRFWGQVVRWMAYQRTMAKGETMRLFFSPDRPLAGDVLTLNANVMNPAGEPLQEGTVVVRTTSPSGKSSSVTLNPAGPDSWGLFTGNVVPDEGGTWTMETICRETNARLTTEIAIQGIDREQRGQPARFEVLREIADITRGEFLEHDQIDSIADRIAALPDPEANVRRVRIWCHPLWGGLILLMLGLFWTGRKLAGVI